MATSKSLRRTRRATNERAHGALGKFWLGLAAVVFYPLTRLLARPRLLGLERIPVDGPVLLVLNHVSHLDPVYDAVAVHRAGRIPRFLAKSTLWNVPVLKHVLTGVQQIPVYRGTSDARKSLIEAHHALGENKAILIYPDGTVTKDPQGWPMTPRPGVARLALDHDVPVVPVARWGTNEVYDHYATKFRPLPRKTVTVAVGEPVDLDAYRHRERDAETLREVTDVIMRRVRDQLAEIRGETAPAEFYSPTRKPVASSRQPGSSDDGAQADGAQADGAQADGAQADGAQANGAQANGAQANGAQPSGNGAAPGEGSSSITDKLAPNDAFSADDERS